MAEVGARTVAGTAQSACQSWSRVCPGRSPFIARHEEARAGPLSAQQPASPRAGPRVHWRPMPRAMMPHAALPVERRRRAVLNAPLKCSDRALSTFKSARLPVMRVSRPVRETAGPGSMQLAPSLMRTLVRTCTS